MAKLPDAKIIVSKGQHGQVKVQCGQSGSDRVLPAGQHAPKDAERQIRDLKQQLERAGNRVEIVER